MKTPTYQRRATSTRRVKLRSAEALRERLRVWLVARGGVQETESAFDGKLCVLGGDVRLLLAKGALLVHLPGDDDLGVGFSVNTWFVDIEGGPRDKWNITLHSDANPYSGKWNFSCYDDEEELFRHFTRAVERLPNFKETEE